MSDLLAVPRTDVIEGYTLMPLALPAFSQLRRHFEASYLGLAAVAAEGKTASVEKRLMEAAHEFINRGNFEYGMRAHRFAMLADDNLPFLLCLCLKEKHPDMTPAKADRLAPQAIRQKVHNACLECAGWDLSPKKAEAQSQTNPL